MANTKCHLIAQHAGEVTLNPSIGGLNQRSVLQGQCPQKGNMKMTVEDSSNLLTSSLLLLEF